jgi:hypothetical protein
VYKLRFIRDWGTFKAGDIKETISRDTARALVNIHGRAELLPGSDPLPSEADEAIFNETEKMLREPSALLGPDGKPLR